MTVVGGSNVDVKLTLHEPAVPGTSNPGRTVSSAGGVARNVAENLARLGVPARLLSVVGRDALGDQLLHEAREAGVDVTRTVRSDTPTGSYTAILNPDGELVIAVAAMDAMDRLTVREALGWQGAVRGAALVVMDANVPLDVMRFVARETLDARVPLIVEPVSVAKSVKVRALLREGLPVHTITPNQAELEQLVQRPLANDETLLEAVEELHQLGVACVWVRLGSRGSLLSGSGGVTWLPAFPAVVADVTGAGDAMLAGYAYARLRGHDVLTAARYGHAAAAITLESTFTVHPQLTVAALETRVQGVS